MSAELPAGPWVETKHGDIVYRFYGRGVWYWRWPGFDWDTATVPHIPLAVFILISQLCVPAP